MRVHCLLLGPVLAAVVLASPGRALADEAAQPAAPARESKEGAAIRAAGVAYRAALTKGDLEPIASFWTADADYVDQSGRPYKIHAGLERAKRLSQESAHIALLSPKTETISIRAITPDVAIEDGTFERTNAEPGHSPHGRYTAVWVNRDGKWLLDGVRESPARLETSVEALKGLGWLVGDWVAEGPLVTAEISCTWGHNKSYIVAELTMRPTGGNNSVSATQLIGWDPVQQRIRSVQFDSRGGSTEGVWTNEGDGWTVKTTATLPDGTRASSTKLYSRIDDNTAIWESIDDESNGQAGVDMRLKLTRKTAK